MGAATAVVTSAIAGARRPEQIRETVQAGDVDLPPAVADEVTETRSEPATAFGSGRVQVRIGAQVWETSVFPSRQRSTYVLPVRKSVRRSLDVEPGDEVDVTVSW